MSMPTLQFPKKTYRNPLDQVLKFLNAKHGDNWWIWEFRAEGTGYRDEDVYGRVFHAPFPDHHPPPFALVPAVLASMRNHLKGEDGKGKEGRVAVVHCKGLSLTISTEFLILSRLKPDG
jgi:protein-tyrosine phosphatase